MSESQASQRRLVAIIFTTTLVILGLVIADLAIGGRPDPRELRAAATLLDGSWRFHTGDDARWADADTDDSDWELIDLTAAPGSHDSDVGLPDYVGGWMAHGHPAVHPARGVSGRANVAFREGASIVAMRSTELLNTLGARAILYRCFAASLAC
jgi:hypothetical protein